ncbi:hypothetical protein HA402_006894, partial [Bradysia odoriphaga]
YDTRGAHAGTPSHWREEEVLEDRAIFRTIREPAELIISPVLEKDVGNFRCRVDFKLTPTRNSNINLEVVVPPHPPKIFNDRGEHIQSRAGPYEEGGDLHLVCVVTGGSPPPTITWSNNGQILSSTMADYSPPSTLNSKLTVRNLSRIHQHALYTCQASNFHKKGVSTNITIELFLRPLSVEIVFSSQPLSADRGYDIECMAIGSRPASKITWWMGGIELSGHTQTVSADGNISTSTLHFTPTRQDNGKTLVCRATNELVKRGMKEASMKLNVCFVPTLLLDLGSNLNPEDIEEGDDVYFECKVHANPAAYKVIWKHNGQTVQHNQKTGIIVSSGDLALQGVTRHQAGNYTCIASNVEGDGESNTVELKVMYKPMCRPDQKRIYGVARNEAAEILCEVDAFPPPDVFKWSFNNTAEMIDMPSTEFVKQSLRASKLTYTPTKEMDFGTIMCWADNVVGQQKEPCVFHLIAAGKPDSPYNCSLVNQTSDSLEVDCTEGFDGGGQGQIFIMETFDQHTGVLQANVSSKYPIFNVGGLDAGKLLKILIYAANAKGKSEAVALEAYTLKVAEKQTGTHNQFELTPILSVGIFIGVLTALICIALGTIAAIKIRTAQHRRQQHQKGKPNNISRPGNLPIKEKISLPLSQSEEMYDEKNPDVVPYNEDPDYKLKSAAQTPATLHNSRSNDLEVFGRPVDDRKTYLNAQTDELHYAELSITMPRNNVVTSDTSNLSAKKPPAYDYFDEPTIYAQIDHYKTISSTGGGGGGTPSSQPPSVISPSSTISTSLQYPSKPFSREIVTIRTPLIYTQQESCV